MRNLTINELRVHGDFLLSLGFAIQVEGCADTDGCTIFGWVDVEEARPDGRAFSTIDGEETEIELVSSSVIRLRK